MEVSSDCGLPVASLVWRPTAESWMLTVVCKGTFVRKHTELVLRERQEPPTPSDIHWEDDWHRSLRVASDLVPMKPRVDIVLVGHAYAPNGTPVRRLTARLSVAELDKEVEIVADPHGSATFDRMPLVYERASFSAAHNPVGIEEASAPGVASNLHLVRSSLATKDVVSVGAFGPISPSWPWRGAKRGSLASESYRTQPLPADFDPRHFNHAPPDQQIERLAPHTRFLLENLDRDAPLVEFELPVLRPWLVVERDGSYVREETADELPLMRCDTVTIDTDGSKVSFTWRAQVALQGPDDVGRAIVSLDPLRSSHGAPSSGGRPSPPPSPWPKLGSTGLPFRKLSAGEVPAPPPSWAPPPPPDSAVGRPPSVRMPRNTARLVAPPSSFPIAPAAPSSWSSSAAAPPPLASLSAEPIAPPHSSSPWLRPDPQQAEAAVPSALVPQARHHAEPLVSASPPEPPRRSAPLERGEVLQLLWFDPLVLPRARRLPDFEAVLEPLERRPRELELEDASEEQAPADIEDRRDVFEILSQAPATTEDKWGTALAAATLVGGRFVPSIVLASGELVFAFDELSMLKATLSVATPLVGADEGLKRAIQDARDFLALPDLLSPAAVVEGFTTRIGDAFRKLKRGHPANYLELHAERALTERRHYQKREVFGAQHLRTTLQRGAGTRPVPAYLPEALATKLPLYARLRVRILAELHLPEDPSDAHEATLKVLALGRLAVVGNDAKPAGR